MKAKGIKLKDTIVEHIFNNKKEYIIIVIFFIIGIFLGVLFVNNVKEEQRHEISNYINNFTEKMKSSENLDNMSVLISSIKQNILITLGLWFFGTTVIRNTNCFWINTL